MGVIFYLINVRIICFDCKRVGCWQINRHRTRYYVKKKLSIRKCKEVDENERILLRDGFLKLLIVSILKLNSNVDMLCIYIYIYTHREQLNTFTS